ncbi:MAG: SUMF1/EgtB/PvdO family nonheme iron enzyme, partial [Fuerstiella sp.]
MSADQRKSKLLSGGRYELVRLLGSGGMGEVYLARDTTLDTQVVIKIPHLSLLKDKEFTDRFRREIQSLVKLSHRSIVKITDVGEHKKIPFAVMQYLDGGSLEDRMEPGAMDEASLEEWLPDVALALDFIHAKGYVHRDVKPANILFDGEGHAYVADFGVAKAVADGPEQHGKATRLTGAGIVMGTPGYMAPELVMGEAIDHRVDQYALAATVFEVLSGRPPFEGPTPAAVMVKQSTMAAPSLQTICPSASSSVAAAVERGLCQAATDRFENCGEFADAVRGVHSEATPTKRDSSESRPLECPACGTVLPLQAKHAKKLIRCSGCREKLRVDATCSRLTVSGSSESASHSTVAVASGSRRTGKGTKQGKSQRSRRPLSAVDRLNSAVDRLKKWATENPAVSMSVGAVAGTLLVLLTVSLLRESSPETTPLNTEVAEATAGESSDMSSNNESVSVSEANETSNDIAGRSAEGPVLSIISLPSQTIDEEIPLELVIQTSIPLTDVQRFSLSETAPDGMQIDRNTGRLIWTPTEIQGPGNFAFEAQVTDLSGRSVFCAQPLTVQVTEVNVPPTFDAIDPVSAKSGEKLSVRMSASDGDYPANDIRFALGIGAPEGVAIDVETGELSWDIVATAESGQHSVAIIATDNSGARAEARLQIQITKGKPITNSIGMTFNLIPAGEFMMGSPRDENGRINNESQHDVRITRTFYLQTTEVTQEQYQQAMGTNPSYFKGKQNPVEQVSWDAAIVFCRKLSELPAEKSAGYVYRLPTEAEWEYACRAGTTTQYSFGDNDAQLGDYAWFGNNSGDKQIDALKIWETVQDIDNYSERILGNNCRSHPVGEKKPNPWGLYDMHGNLSEWCQDLGAEYPSGSVTDPTGAASGSDRVFRGGSWFNSADYCQSADRGGFSPSYRIGSLGFRVVRSSVQDTSPDEQAVKPEADTVESTNAATVEPQAISQDQTQNGVPTVNSIDMKFKPIIGGTFTMGENDEAHQVTLTKGFEFGVYEVTQEQFQKVMGSNPSEFKGPQNPVEKVSWDEAVEFCGKLSELPAEKSAGYVYRLPTEAEWEYACRAGTKAAYS